MLALFGSGLQEKWVKLLVQMPGMFMKIRGQKDDKLNSKPVFWWHDPQCVSSASQVSSHSEKPAVILSSHVGTKLRFSQNQHLL